MSGVVDTLVKNMVKTRQGEGERAKWGQINIKYNQISMHSNTGRHNYTDIHARAIER